MTLWLKILEKVSFFTQKIDFDENMPPQIYLNFHAKTYILKGVNEIFQFSHQK